MRYRAIFTGVYSGLISPSDGDCKVMITACHKPAFTRSSSRRDRFTTLHGGNKYDLRTCFNLTRFPATPYGVDVMWFSAGLDHIFAAWRRRSTNKQSSGHRQGESATQRSIRASGSNQVDRLR